MATTSSPLLFRSSPFSLVADETSAECWAGRTAVLTQLRKLCRSWANRADSTLDLVWANLGAGKTHALLHLRHLLLTEFRTPAEAFVVYTEVPERESRFVEIYRRLASTLPVQAIAEMALAAGAPTISSNVARAARALKYGNDPEKRLAREWFIGGRPGLRELKAVTGIESRIETDSDAEKVLSEVLGLSAANQRRVVILLDEFQRVGHLPQRNREAMLAHIRSVFSRRPSYLSLVLGVGSRIEKTAVDLLPPELKTIMGMRPTISLPEMDKTEAVEFMIRRLAWYRPAGYSGAAEAPFTNEQLKFVVTNLADRRQARLIPRTLLQVFGLIYDEITLDDSPPSEEDLQRLLDTLRSDE